MNLYLTPKFKKIKSRPPIYGNTTLKIAIEFGIVLSEVAYTRGIQMTPEISIKAEEVLIRELRVNGLGKTAANFVPLILAVLGERKEQV